MRAFALTVVVLCAASPAAAATPIDFYTSLLRRGVAAYEGGRFDEAARQLRIAAFGLVDAVESYETAQTYLALTYTKLGDPTKASEAVRRVAIADRNQSKYASLTLPNDVRSAFLALAAKTLSPAELASLQANRTQSTPQTATTTPPKTTAPSTTTNDPPKQPVAPPPPVVVERVDVETQKKPPVQAQPQQQPPKTATTQPQQAKPAPTQQGTNNKPAPAQSTTKPIPPPPTLTAKEISSRLATAENALNAANLPESRRLYRELLAANGVDRASYLRVAEGLYRARDFAGALAAFDRVGALRKGEEPYRYYIAVAFYETSQYAKAKTELAAVLPFIEITPDVARYRAKIEGARN